MRKFETSDQVHNWLKENGRDRSICFTARNALRMIPELLLHERSEIDDERLAKLCLAAFRAVATLAAVGAKERTRLDTETQSLLCFRAYKYLAETRAERELFTEETHLDDDSNISGEGEENIDLAIKAIEIGATSGILISDEPEFYMEGAFGASMSTVNGRLALIDVDEVKKAAIATVAATVSMESDADVILSGKEMCSVFLTPLWKDGWRSPRIIDGWVDLRKRLIDQDPNWAFWIDLYERFVLGSPTDWSRLLDVLSLSDEFWAKNPTIVNQHLFSTRASKEKHSNTEQTTSAISIEELLRDPTLLAASTDFEYDKLEHLIRLAPFHEDTVVQQRISGSAEFAAYISELSDSIGEFLADLESGGSNVPRGLINRLHSFKRELEVPIDEVRPRRLWDLTSYIKAHLEDEDTRFALGDILASELERIAGKQYDLIGRFMRSMLDALQVVDDISMPSYVSANEFLSKASQTLSELKRLSVQELPKFDQDVLDRLADDFNFLEETATSSQVSSSSDNEKNESSRIFWRRAKVFILTIKRLTLRTLQGIHRVFEVTSPYISLIGVAATVFPKPFFAALAALLALLGISLL